MAGCKGSVKLKSKLENIKNTTLAKAVLLLLLLAITAQGQQDYGQAKAASQYLNEPYSTGQYETTIPAGAPVPAMPESPQELGLSIPAEDSTYAQAPPATETGRALIAADLAYGAEATSTGQSIGQPSGDLQKAAFYMEGYGTSSGAGNHPTQSMAVVAPGAVQANKLYVPYVPQTVAGCRLGGWLPMWLQTSGPGPIWFYEWYPSGRLSVNYLGYASGGWQKKWFNGDTPGWHILQYHSSGWSNYIYIYVYPASSGRWTDLGPYGGSPSSTTPTYSGTSSVTMRSTWFKGYDVYLDGKYIGSDGKGSDALDGVYSFRVPGNMWHTIVISKGAQSYDESGTFLNGAAYRFTL